MKKLLAVAAVVLVSALAAELSLVQPKDFAAELSRGAKPAIIHVGFNVLYRSHHVPGSLYAGPASKPEGLALLQQAVKNLPRDREIVIYCGCCPWDHCPNIKPAFEELARMGFTHVRALSIPTNFKIDWMDHGYPVEP